MRILYLSQYFPPEIGATQTRAYEMARGLIRAGHAVTVLTEFPNHPAGIVPDEYRGRLWERTELDGIDVLRVWVRPSPSKTVVRRLVFYSSYMTMATVAGLLLARGPFDLVFATSPPLFVGAAGMAVSALRRAPLIFEVRDLWPEAAVELGELEKSWARQLAEWLESLCYRRARRVVVVTRGSERRLAERGVVPGKLVVIPNGANTEIYRPQPPDPSLRRDLGLEPEKFVAVFAGLHGLAQDLETILDCARLLTDRSEIVFLFVGDGPRKTAIVERAKSMRLANVVFHDPVPDRELPRYLALANVGIHAARRLDISRRMLPAKVFSYMACGLPVIVAMEGEVAELLAEAGAGWAVSPEDPEALGGAIDRLRGAPGIAEDLGRSGREFVCAKFSRQELATRLATTLEAAVRSGRP